MTHDNSAAIPRRTYTAADGRTVELIGKPSEELMARVLKKLIDSELRRRAEAGCPRCHDVNGKEDNNAQKI